MFVPLQTMPSAALCPTTMSSAAATFGATVSGDRELHRSALHLHPHPLSLPRFPSSPQVRFPSSYHRLKSHEQFTICCKAECVPFNDTWETDVGKG